MLCCYLCVCVQDGAYASLPNTNKCLIETYCGLTPHLATTWGDLKSEAVTASCLPKLLAQSGQYITGWFGASKRQAHYTRLGFMSTIGVREILGIARMVCTVGR